ncbi:ExbD/TolR family protein [Haloferula chungangensis]|uniref:ExbD/TolR family protein n=1 Tax=Haloferula chungangensis TaxID=1048331 RepID=A0ABW2LDL9_9BACT
MKFQNREPKPAEMQMAPMIDIVFLLLIFFIVTWQFSRDEMDLKIAVPTSEEGADPQRVLGEIVLNVRADGSVSVWGETKTKASLAETLKAIAAQHKNQPVRVRGDSNTPFQQIVEVIDICQKSGIWNISFATQKPAEGD